MRGQGDPNEEGGAYQRALSVLYALCYTLKMSKLGDRRIDAIVTQSGCMGYCNAEPTVEITLPGQEPVVFGDVTPERASELITKYVLHGELVDGIIPHRHNTQF